MVFIKTASDGPLPIQWLTCVLVSFQMNNWDEIYQNPDSCFSCFKLSFYSKADKSQYPSDKVIVYYKEFTPVIFNGINLQC